MSCVWWLAVVRKDECAVVMSNWDSSAWICARASRQGGSGVVLM